MRRLAACLLSLSVTLVVVAPPSQAHGPVRYEAHRHTSTTST